MSKSDFLSWDKDLDLDFLLGEYTDYDGDYNSEDDDNFREAEAQKSNSKSSSKSTGCKQIYKCPECHKDLKTISGFRGHVRKQHGLNIKATDCKIDTHIMNQGRVMLFDENVFPELFETALKSTVVNIRNDPFIDEGETISECCNEFVDNYDVQKELYSVISPVFLGLVADISTSADREQIFRGLHQQRSDRSLVERFGKLLPTIKPTTINVFIQLIFEDIVGELMKERLKLVECQSRKKHEAITENDKNILYYIAGYIIRSLRKKYHNSPNLSFMEVLSSTEEANSKHDKWYRIQSRGGLQRPSDMFFLLVGELEIVARECIKSDLHANALMLNPLKERMMESNMVKHYCNKMNSAFPVEILEDILQLFLTIRGFACVRVERSKLARTANKPTKKSSGLRQSLRDLRRL